jgi:SAM-dependent MidA family methyltransferase
VTEFEAATENSTLKELIVRRILDSGGISFRDFMAMALYEPGLGYYESPREKMGRSGDYLTSPEVSPIFGAMVGRRLRAMWEDMGRPPAFEAVEAGAGNGALARDILTWSHRASPGFFKALGYTLIEPSAPLRGRQAALIEAARLAHKTRWLDHIPPAIEGCILSNELLDAMPVHRVALEGGRLREIYVDWDGERFIEELREPSTPEIEAYFERLGLRPGEGCRAEVNLEAPRWAHAAGRALARGYVLTFDYGYEAGELYAPWRRDGTLLCFYRHNPSTDPYARIGRQDITAHVDFTTLRRVGEEAGLRAVAFLPQSEFLMHLGVANALPRIAEGETDLEEYYAKRRAITELLDPAGLGRIKVLIQSKGLS